MTLPWLCGTLLAGSAVEFPGELKTLAQGSDSTLPVSVSQTSCSSSCYRQHQRVEKEKKAERNRHVLKQTELVVCELRTWLCKPTVGESWPGDVLWIEMSAWKLQEVALTTCIAQL